MELNIVTPTTRPQNLQRIAQSLTSPRPIKWWVIFDNTPVIQVPCPENVSPIFLQAQESGIAGHIHRNYVLDQIGDNEWFYSVDDDNILHPHFLDELTDFREVVTVQQLNKDLSHRLDADKPILNHMDTAQFAFKKRAAGNLRFDITRYDADGVFIETLFREKPYLFTIINKPLSYYNFLR